MYSKTNFVAEHIAYMERRSEVRYKADKPVDILFMPQNLLKRGRLVDQSATGAKITFDMIDTPPQFVWFIGVMDHTVKYAKVAWCLNNAMGLKIEFVKKIDLEAPLDLHVPIEVYEAYLSLLPRIEGDNQYLD